MLRSWIGVSPSSLTPRDEVDSLLLLLIHPSQTDDFSGVKKLSSVFLLSFCGESNEFEAAGVRPGRSREA